MINNKDNSSQERLLIWKELIKSNYVDTLHKLKEEYMIDNYNKPKDELLIINEVLNNFIDCIGKK